MHVFYFNRYPEDVPRECRQNVGKPIKPKYAGARAAAAEIYKLTYSYENVGNFRLLGENVSRDRFFKTS